MAHTPAFAPCARTEASYDDFRPLPGWLASLLHACAVPASIALLHFFGTPCQVSTLRKRCRIMTSPIRNPSGGVVNAPPQTFHSVVRQWNSLVDLATASANNTYFSTNELSKFSTSRSLAVRRNRQTHKF